MSCCILTKSVRQKQNSENHSENEEFLPLYGPDSMMPSVVDAKLLEETQDSERLRAPGPPV